MDTSLLLTLVTLVISLGVLLISAERFVGATEEVGLALGIPPFVMGISVLAIGTSLPELITGILAVIHGSSELVVGTVLGSNIANILLILGASAVVARSFTIVWDLLHGDLPILFGSLLLLVFVIYPLSADDLAHFRAVNEALAAGVPGVTAGSRSVITFAEALILLMGYGLYLHYYATRGHEEDATGGGEPTERSRVRPASLLWILAGSVGVFFGARYTVDSAVDLAAALGLGSEVIAASLIACGTSMPELVVSLAAVRHGNFEMAMGNVTGSNIFNTFVVLSVPGLLAHFVGTGEPLQVGMDSVLFLQLPYYAGTLVLFLVIVLDKTLTRTEGMVILLAYLLFMVKLFGVI